MSKSLVKLSKFLSVVLRHHPDDFNITLDKYGFTPLDPVWQVITNKFGNRYTHQDLLTVVSGDKSGKKRYEIHNGKIRALYGHSQPVITYEAVQPPATLFHGTNQHALQHIRKEGLTAQNRQYVHLTTNYDNAYTVASRRTSNPIILTIDSLLAFQNGIIFHQPEAEHYLAKAIPPQYIQFSDELPPTRNKRTIS